ncbi:hypothetical protein [Chitinophaga alhagiae]|uniref:hypothetical protein n=1 Tax=Chitinophaga alhagiae TaxID=2203219 RepID=UPI000E5B8690|nr:hypothetical protein [Chitinophaga alhagiae]
MNKLKFGPLMLVATLTGFMAGFVVYRILTRYAAGWMPPVAKWGLSFLMLLAVLLYGVARYLRSRKTDAAQPDLLAPFNVLLVFLLAWDLYSFGWQKIFHLQMVVPLGMLDLPFNSLDGETLTWAYFRRSYPFTVAIGLAQMTSSVMLLFKRTRLLGLIMLVPVLLNIILIDTFYHLHTGVLLHALVLMAGVIYLLYQYRAGLITFFFSVAPTLLPWRKTPWVISLLILTLPLVLLLTYSMPDRHPQFTGKYQVKDLQVNGTPQAARSFRDSVLTVMYMDLQDDIALEFNHHNNRYIGTYQYDEASQRISAKWRYPHSTDFRFEGVMRPLGGRDLRFTGVLAGDSVQMRLVHVPEPR